MVYYMEDGRVYVDGRKLVVLNLRVVEEVRCDDIGYSWETMPSVHSLLRMYQTQTMSGSSYLGLHIRQACFCL